MIASETHNPSLIVREYQAKHKQRHPTRTPWSFLLNVKVNESRDGDTITDQRRGSRHGDLIQYGVWDCILPQPKDTAANKLGSNCTKKATTTEIPIKLDSGMRL